MKGLKSYFSKIAMLLIAIGSVAFLYWYGFYKNVDQACIPQNADAIAMVDAKNIRNYLVFSYLKNPSEWKSDVTFSELKKRFDLSNFGISIPDYWAFFHIENQPISQWSATLKINDETVFESAMTKAHFRKTRLKNGMNSYYSKDKALFIIKHSNQILVSNITEKQIAVNMAEDLFLKKLFLDTKKTEQTICTSNAVTFWIKKNRLLEEDGILNLKLEDQEIIVDAQLKLNYNKQLQFTENPHALLSVGFDFEMIRNQQILKLNSDKINKIIGFNMDSIVAHHPTKTEFTLNEIVEKQDSAISYDYDDDFNPIKKVVVHASREPSFYFSMQIENSKKVYNYLKSQKAIDDQQVFVNFPLAQTKTSILNNALILEANPLKNSNSRTLIPKVGYFWAQFHKLHPKDWRYIAAKNKSFSILKSFQSFEMDLSKENSSVLFKAHLKTRNGIKLISIK